MSNARMNAILWRCCAQLILLGIAFILVRDISINTVFYDVFLSLDWQEYGQYFVSNRLPTIAGIIGLTPVVVLLIFGSTLKELRQLRGESQLSDERRNHFIKKLIRIRRWLVGYFFWAVFLGLVSYTIRGLLTVELTATSFFLELSPFCFGTLLLLYFSNLLSLWLDHNFRDLRRLLNFYLTGDRQRQRQSRNLGITMLFCFGFVIWLVVYYGVVMMIVEEEIFRQVEQTLVRGGEGDLSYVYRSLRISLSEFSRRLAFYGVFDARTMNIDNYVLPRSFNDYLVFVPIFGTAVLGFMIYLFSYARFYNENLEQISQHVRSLLRREVGLKEQIVLQRFDDIGYLTGYLNLLFQLMYRFLKGVTDGADALTQHMGGAASVIQRKVQQLYRLNTVFARNGIRVDSQVQMVAGTRHGIATLNGIVQQIKGEVTGQGEFLGVAGKTVVEFSETVGRVAQHVTEVRDSMEQLAGVAHEGQRAVHESFNIVMQLTSTSYRIRDIVNVIGRISAQTRLLSMSAAIEAAHAENHGEGFAVVSASVRQLSEDADIQNKAIRVQIKNMIHRVLIALNLSKSALSSLRGVQNGVLRSQRLVETIAQAIDTQSGETDKLAQQIEGLRQVTRLILEGADAQMSSLAELERSTDRLTTVVDDLLGKEGEQLRDSNVVMGSLEDLRAQVDEGVDESQRLSETLTLLRLE